MDSPLPHAQSRMAVPEIDNETPKRVRVIQNIMDDFDRVAGTTVRVTELIAYDENGYVVERDFGPDGVLMKVVAETRYEDLVRDMGEGWIDPYWDLVPKGSDPRIEGLRTFFTYGRSYNMDTGEVGEPSVIPCPTLLERATKWIYMKLGLRATVRP